MYEVSLREIPERSLLCLKRNVDEQGMWAFGKEFMGILRKRTFPTMEGREGAAFCIWWGLLTEDSDAPIEWCRPVPAAQAESLASHNPELSLRVEPAHQEAFVALPDGPDEEAAVQWQLAMESLDVWAQDQERQHEGEALALEPEDLGLRVTYLASAFGTAEPYRDMAIPFAAER